MTDDTNKGEPGGAANVIEEATRLIRRGAPPDTVAALLKSGLDATPDDPVLWYELGYVQLQAGHPTAGVEALRRSLALQENPRTWLYLGYAHIEQGAYESARVALTRCLELGGPEQARYELAYACHLEGNNEEAARFARAYVLKVPDDPDGWELYDAVCRQLGKPRTFKRFVARHGDKALVELLAGRDQFSMGAAPFPVPYVGEGGTVEEGSDDVKLDFLAGVGAGYLGAADDDGVTCRSYVQRKLSIDDIAVMLVRAQGVLDAARIEPAAVVSADTASLAVAFAAAELLKVPAVERESHAAGELRGNSLWIESVGHDWLRFRRATEGIGGRVLTFVLALDWMQAGLPFAPNFAPDICGFAALEVAGFEDLPADPAAAAERILDAAHRLPAGEIRTQRMYYRTQPGLRFR